MAEQSFPFENIDTTESQFSQWARNFQSTGIKGTPVGTELKVSAAGTDLNISVASGQSFVRGHYYINTAAKTLAVTSAGINTRIDIVVVELDPVANTIVAKIVEGTAVSSDPVAPTLTQTDTGTYQLPIAVITIPNSTIAITNGMITDVRTFMSHDIGLWTTSTRPASPIENQTLGFNTDLDQHEFWNGSAWVEFTPTDSVRVSDYVATGDILVAAGASDPARLPIGGNGALLKSNGTTASWLAVGTNGQVLGSDGTTSYWRSVPTPNKVVNLTDGQTGGLGNEAGYHGFGRTGSGSLYVGGNEVPPTATFDAQVALSITTNATVEYYSPYVSYQVASTNDILSISYGNNIYFAGFSASTSAGVRWAGVSTNGTTWTDGSFASVVMGVTGSSLGGIIYSNGLYIIGSDTGKIWTSTDTLTWTSRTSGTTNRIYSFRDGGGRIVGTVNNTTPISSTDGITWTTSTYGGFNYSQNHVNQLATYGANGWVIANTYNSTATSGDGVTWTSRTWAVSASQVYAITYGNGVYVMAGYVGTLASTANPTTGWTLRTSGTTSTIYSLAYGAGLFVYGTGGGGIRTSPDGTTWTARTSGTTSDIFRIQFINNRFIASLGNGNFKTSTDGITWSADIVDVSGSISQNQIAYANGKHIFGAQSNIWISTDLLSFDVFGPSLSAPTQDIVQKCAYLNGIYLMGSFLSRLSRSTDGIYWRNTAALASGGQNLIYGLDYGTSVGHLAVGQAGKVFQSNDNGITWTTRTSGTANDLYAVAASSTNAIAVGASNTLLTSTNGVTWTVGTTSIGATFYNAAYGNSTFVGVTSGGVIYTSPDGTTWTQRASGYSMKLGSLNFANGKFMGTSANADGKFYFSTDGISWRTIYSNTTETMNAVAAVGSTFIAGGTNSRIIKPAASPTGATLYASNYGNPVALV